MRRRWWVSFLLLLGLLGIWLLATPPLAAPDEPQHLAKAAAVVRGQFLGPSAEGPRTHVTLPAGFGDLFGYPGCFAFHTRQPASCAPPVTDRGGPGVDLTTTAGRYPPVYYALVGLPTLVVEGLASDLAARVLSALLCAALLATALVWSAAAGGPRLAPVAIALGFTPMVLFLSVVVNPSGLEVAAAAAAWAGLLRLVHTDTAITRGLLVGAVAVMCALVVARPISVFWMALIVGLNG
jgi:hypothetical protein